MPYLSVWKRTGSSSSSAPTFGTLDPDDVLPETIPLYLPSGLPINLRFQPQVKELREKERKLCIAECLDALASLRRRLRIGARLFDQKTLHAAGTGTRRNTRMQSLIDQYVAKKNRDAERYRAGRKALLAIDANGDWTTYLLPLRPEDETAPFRAQEERKKKQRRTGESGKSEGYRTLSWIWRTVPQSAGGDSSDMSNEEVEEGLFGFLIS